VIVLRISRGRIDQEKEVGARVIPKRSGQEDWGKRNDHSQLGGCYVPAGRYPCLTSAVMFVILAKVAGVKRIVACSPPGREGGINFGILYTMHKMGVDEIYCLGGAQAIGAFAFETQTIRPVDLIVGPGNQYVMEAKRQVFGIVGIDFLAGPSECFVVADETGRADFIAADLLA
jgi:sulfopropanediol 3-dehydrogenase